MERNSNNNNNFNSHSNTLRKGNQFIRGWSWGEIRLENGQIDFEGDNKPWFSIPYQGIANALLPSKNEIGLEFNIDDEGDSREDLLSEMRLYIPNRVPEGGENEEEAKEKSEEDQREGESKHTAEILKEEIMKFANIGTLGEALAHVPEVPMITPRGKFDLYMLKNVLKIHGPSHDYKISYKNISKTFLLPKPDGTHCAFVVGLNNPVGQGNTKYPYLVFQFKNKTVRTINLNLPEEEDERKTILKSDIDNELKGELFDIVAKLFKSIIGIPIIIPGSFRSSKGASCVKCSIKASEGALYPLERGLIFIHKPVVYIGLENVSQVEFSRISDSSAQQRTFDLTIVGKRKDETQLVGLEKNELEPLTQYFSNKKIKIISNDGGNIQDIQPTTTTSSRKARKAPEEVPMELPSDEEEFDESFRSGDDDMDVDDESEEGSSRKKKNKGDKKRK